MEFITGAVDMPPRCGVSRTLVEKLAAKSPNSPTKMKILAAIEEEHNVKWDPEAFEERVFDPSDDLLNGPNTIDVASGTQVKPPAPPPRSTTQVPPKNCGNAYPRGPPPPSFLEVPPQNNEKHDVPMNVNEQNARSSPHFRDSASSDVFSDKESTSVTFHPERRSSGNGTDGMENRHSFPGDGTASSMARQNWNLNLKDAASAAQPDPESAEMASMAARAAAELSRQHCSESREKFRQSASSSSSRASRNNDHVVIIHQRIDQYLQKKSSEPGKRDCRGGVSMDRQSSDTNVYSSEMQTEMKPDSDSYVGDMRSEEKSSRHFSQSGSPGEVITKRQPRNTNVSASEMQTGMKPDAFSYSGYMNSKDKSSSNSSGSGSTGESRKRQPSNTNVFANEMQTGTYSGDIRSEEKSSRLSCPSYSSSGSGDQQNVLGGNGQFSYLGDMRTGDQSVRSSSSSHAGNLSCNVGNASDGPGIDSFVSSANTYQSSMDASLVSYGYYSDDDKCKFAVEDYQGPESNLHIPSPGRNSFSPSADLDAWNSKQQADELQYKSTSHLSCSSSAQHSPPVFSETLTSPTDPLPPKELLSVAFDASDSPSSDGEDGSHKSKFSQCSVSKLSTGQRRSACRRSSGSSTSEEVNVCYNQKSIEGSQVVKNTTVSEIKSDSDEFPTSQPFPGQVKSGVDLKFKDGFQTAQLCQTMKGGEVAVESSSVSDADNELKYGTFTGGLRNKGYKHPPYTRKPNSLPVKQVAVDTKIKQSCISTIVRTSNLSGNSSQDQYNLKGSSELVKEWSRRTRVPNIASDDDSSEDEPSHGTMSSSQGPYNKNLGTEVKASSRSTHGFFDSEDSQVEDDLLTKISTSNVCQSATLSRTQPSSNSVRSSTVASDMSGFSDYGKASKCRLKGVPKANSETVSGHFLNHAAAEPENEVEMPCTPSNECGKRGTTIVTKFVNQTNLVVGFDSRVRDEGCPDWMGSEFKIKKVGPNVYSTMLGCMSSVLKLWAYLTSKQPQDAIEARELTKGFMKQTNKEDYGTLIIGRKGLEHRLVVYYVSCLKKKVRKRNSISGHLAYGSGATAAKVVLEESKYYRQLTLSETKRIVHLSLFVPSIHLYCTGPDLHICHISLEGTKLKEPVEVKAIELKWYNFVESYELCAGVILNPNFSKDILFLITKDPFDFEVLNEFLIQIMSIERQILLKDCFL